MSISKLNIWSSRTCSEILSPVHLFLQFFSQNYKISKNFCTKPHHICTWCSHIKCTSKRSAFLYSNPFCNGSATI